MTTQTVREIALESPSSIRVFEQFGIDYCCGGRKPLADACASRNIAVDEVIAALERAAAGPVERTVDWTSRPLAVLAEHIVAHHHSYIRQEVPRLAALAERVVNRHGDTKPELLVIQQKVAEVSAELLQHIQKEESVLFPHIAQLEKALAEGSARPHGCFGTVANPIAMMSQEHDAAGALMAQIRELSQDFTPPVGACPTFLAFYRGLQEFEQDLHQHIHLENNILFPRAIVLEASGANV